METGHRCRGATARHRNVRRSGCATMSWRAMSHARARDIYKVALTDELEIDAEATAALRTPDG